MQADRNIGGIITDVDAGDAPSNAPGCHSRTWTGHPSICPIMNPAPRDFPRTVNPKAMCSHPPPPFWARMANPFLLPRLLADFRRMSSARRERRDR